MLDDLTPEEAAAIVAALQSMEFQLLIGAEDWDLTEEQEMALWAVIERTK